MREAKEKNLHVSKIYKGGDVVYNMGIHIPFFCLSRGATICVDGKNIRRFPLQLFTTFSLCLFWGKQVQLF